MKRTADVPAGGRRRGLGWLEALAALPEANLLFFAFLVNYPWEFLQVPLFVGLAEAPHWQAVKFCSAAALGDAVLTLALFWLVAAVERDRRWIRRPPLRAVALFVGAGLGATVVLEWLATGPLDRWHYAPSMPTVPLFGTGLSPVVQWLVLPLVVLGIVRRQLAGAEQG